MAKKDFTTPLSLNGQYPNLDDRYTNNGDPYVSKNAAETALASKLNAYHIGLTVLVADEDDPDYPEAKEYWVQPYDNNGVTAYHLVEKQPQIDTSGFATKTEVNAKQDALPSGTTGQVLKKTANSVEWDDMPTIGDGTNTALPIVGNVKVSAVTASGSTAGVTVTPGQNTGEIKMQFTLPKGDKGEDGADGQDGQDGAPGHNPCLGRFNAVPTLSPNPFEDAQAGDYIYVDIVDITDSSSTTTYIYYFDGEDWDENGTEVDISNETFRTGEDIHSVPIDSTNLVNPPSGSLAKAEDIVDINGKLDGVSFHEEYNIGTSLGRYYITNNGTLTTISSQTSETVVRVIPLRNATSVRFLSMERAGTNTSNIGYCFGHFENEPESTPTATDFDNDNFIADDGETYEANKAEDRIFPVEKAVPDGATHLAITLWASTISTHKTNFYCYLQSGERVVDLIPQVVNNLVTDDATKALSAKQGKEIYDALSGAVDVNFNDYEKIQQYIRSDNTWSTDSSVTGGYIIPLDGVVKVYIKAKADVNAQYAFLTSQSHVGEDAIDTVSGEEGGRKTVGKGTEITIVVPITAQYIYIAYSVIEADIQNYGGRLPEQIQFTIPYGKINKEEENKAIADSVVNVEIKPFESPKSISSSTGNWISSSESSPLYHYQIPVCGGEHFHITPSTTSSLLRYAFLSEIGTTAPTYSSGGLVSIDLTTEGNRVPIDIVIPDGTKFLYIQAGAAAPSCIQIGLNATIARDWDNMMNKDTNLSMVAWPPATTMTFAEETSKALGILEESLSPSDDNDVLTTLELLKDALDNTITNSRNDVVKSLQVLNALKKADQLRLVTFTPKHDIPTGSSSITPVVISARTLRTSIPYSSNNDDLKLVGIQVSLHTFMTAINNPYSLMYTERCNSDNSKSAWGKVYESGNAWSYYGTVCCGLTSSVYGVDYKVHNGVIGRPYRDFGNYIPLAPAGEVDWNNLQVGDIGNRYERGVHSFMIYKLKRDGNGAITNVDIIESSSSVATSATGNGSGGIRTKSYTKAQFESFMNVTYIHTLFRYAKAYKNTNYEQSPFVTLTDYGEVAGTPFAYNNEICTFAGDKASFAKGDLVVLNYNLDDNHPATTIKVYKDDELEPTIYTSTQANDTYSDYASLSANGFNVIDQTNHVLILGTELLPGKYKACINDSENYTYWEVLDTDVTIAKVDDDTYKLIFREEPSVVYLPCFNEHGSLRTYAIKEADMYEKRDKSMIIHPKSQYTLSMYSTYPYDGKIRVAVKGEYGIATGAVVELEPTEE